MAGNTINTIPSPPARPAWLKPGRVVYVRSLALQIVSIGDGPKAGLVEVSYCAESIWLPVSELSERREDE